MKRIGAWLLVGTMLFQAGCSSSSTPSEGVRSSTEPYRERYARQKKFVHAAIGVEVARAALRAAIRLNPVIEGVPLTEDLVFSDWDFHFDCLECSVQAGDWIVGLVSEGGEELTGISFSIGFDPKTKQVLRTGSTDQIHFDFDFRHGAAGWELVFVGVGADHFELTP